MSEAFPGITQAQQSSPGGEFDSGVMPLSNLERSDKHRVAQEEWLERRGLLADTPRLMMTEREYRLLNICFYGGATTYDEARRNYGLPQDAHYTWVDVMPDDSNLSSVTTPVVITNKDFGTVIEKLSAEELGVEPQGAPHITMTERERNLFSVVGMARGGYPSLVEHVRSLYGITPDQQDDQFAPKYALIDVVSDDPSIPNESLLVDITEKDFGTVIEVELDKTYPQADDADPDSPLAPKSGNAYMTIDISDAISDSTVELRGFAHQLMDRQTANPLEGRFWVRAGDVATGKSDAFVWENGRPFASAAALTMAFPSQYGSICVVVGERQDPANGKPGMAQIHNPEVVLKIEGENLALLKKIYGRLYAQPDFALTTEQRQQRDKVFNDYIVLFISDVVENNRAREQARRYDEERRRRIHRNRQPPRSLPLPGASTDYRTY